VGTGFSSVAVGDGRVYTMGNDAQRDTVFCFDANSGAQVWKYSYASPMDPKFYEGGPSATPTIDSGRVYTLSKRGLVNALNAADGKLVWSKDLAKAVGATIPTWGFASSALVEGNLVVFNVGSAGAALDKATGNVVWKSGGSESGYSTAVPFDAGANRGVLLFLATSVAAVNLSDGRLIWSHPWKTEYDVNAADPIMLRENVFISSGYERGGALLKISGKSASVVWENKNMRNHFNSCVLLDGYLYGFDESELKCLDFNTGQVRWRQGSLGKGSLMAADGKLIILSERGELVIADASSNGFKALSRAQVLGGKCWSAPVLSNGRIYCRNAKGDLVCVDVSGK
jgi:outer membrane protein assembly factor BamB